MRKWMVPSAVVALMCVAGLAFAEDAAAPAASALTAEIKIGTSIENREPLGVAETFPADTSVLVGWTRIKGAQEPVEVVHVWKRNGEEAARVPLNVQSSNYRTYSRKTIAGMAGEWTLSVEDPSGNVIGTESVTVGTAAQ